MLLITAPSRPELRHFSYHYGKSHEEDGFLYARQKGRGEEGARSEASSQEGTCCEEGDWGKAGAEERSSCD
ncbi:MAG: hypothetical protein M3032_00785 [Verrucomicrobiota bacterium]|nr:hypothetical protein [Verrucomicrobiota bacterium]